MGFWTNNPCSPTWFSLAISWLTGHPPTLLNIDPPMIPIHSIRGCTFAKATHEDVAQLSEFWESWFSTSRCTVPQSKIRSAFEKGIWDIFVARDGNQVIGSIVRRWIHGLHVKEAYIPRAGIIDFLCVHPAWKSKGIGRSLISIAQNACPRPFPPHLMLWESYIPTNAPTVMGSYWLRECVVGERQRITEDQERMIWNKMKEGRPIWSEYTRSEDIHIYPAADGAVVIWNSWHRRVPQGDYIGIVLACSSQAAMTEYIKCSPFGVLLGDTQYEGWSSNGGFQWGLYNMNTGFIDRRMPLLSII